MLNKENLINKILTCEVFTHQPVVIGKVKAPGLGHTLQKIRKELLIKKIRKKSIECFDKTTEKSYIMLFSDIESIDGMSIERLAESLKINN